MFANTTRQGVQRFCAAIVLGIGSALAATTDAVSAEDTGAAGKARAVLETHCARCHEAGKLENPPAKGGLGNVLDLDGLSGREDLVTPGDPDASRLYQIMLANHRPLSVFFGPVPGPSAAEIAAVRDWLAGLPPRPADCAGKSPVTTAEISRDIGAWRKAFETDPEKPLRFVSLTNLHNLCRSDAKLAEYRTAVARLMSRLTLRSVTSLDTIGDASVILAFRPSDLGLTAEAWDLRAGPGDNLPGVVEAEKLAARAIAASAAAATGAAIPNPVSRAIAAPAGEGLIDGLDPVDALALEHTRLVTPSRAAVELHMTVDALRERLSGLVDEEDTTALRLAQTGLPRSDWEAFMQRLTNRPAARGVSVAPSPAPASLGLALWTNALAYRAGDLLTVNARPTADCNLTIIAVETGGLATVLFPNDTATDNRVKGGALVQVPPPGAPFQLRLDKPGRHGLVAICNATAKRPQGIGHDFERQRFTVLGDWRTF